MTDKYGVDWKKMMDSAINEVLPYWWFIKKEIEDGNRI